MKKILLAGLVVCLLIAGLAGYLVYDKLLGSNNIARTEPFEFYIHTGTSYNEVLAMLEDSVVKDIRSFEWLAGKMNYPSHVYPGRYIIQSPMSSRDLLVLLRSGKQVPVKLVLNKYRTKDELAGFVSK